MIRRLALFVRGSYPLPLAAVFAAAWAVGATGLYAATDPRAHDWRPGWGTAVAAVTVVVDLLLLRAADDLRDLPYDRVHNPGRPLARGAVRPRDLVVLMAVGAAGLLLLNSGNRPAQLLLAAQFAYTAALVGAELRSGWPPGDAVVLSVLLSSPIQIVLNLYLYAVFLHDTGLSAGRRALPVLAVLLLAATHHELARKLVRDPAARERTYVHVFGLRTTTALAVGFAAASTAVSLAVLRPWSAGTAGHGAWGWLVLLPAVVVARAAWSFTRGGAARWPLRATVGYLPTAFTCYLLIGLGATS
ncbi:hypothetical protein [Streptomyces sp. NPDC089799]|uniref:hypothetical protein n=1 Tax=Streptomyces sp. NPDC089799 TaxID=3155066 RepID=UPI00342D152D